MLPKLEGIHHVAYRCHNAKITKEFYEKTLGMEFQMAFSEDYVPSTGAYDPYMHIFMDCGGGNILAFFELPKQPAMGFDPNSPKWVQHIAFAIKDYDSLLSAKQHIESLNIEVIGPINHGIFQSIYFFDPNGHRLELAANCGTKAQLQELKTIAPLMLEEWDATKIAPRHAAYLHEN